MRQGIIAVASGLLDAVLVVGVEKMTETGSKETTAALTGAADASQTTGQLAGVLTTNLGPGRDKLLVRGLSDGAFTGRARSTVSTSSASPRSATGSWAPCSRSAARSCSVRKPGQ